MLAIALNSLGSLITIQEKWPKLYGRIFRVWFGFQSFVDISSPQLMEVIIEFSIKH